MKPLQAEISHILRHFAIVGLAVPFVYVNDNAKFTDIEYTVADLGGRSWQAPPPSDQNFLNFMGFFRKCINILGWRPPKGLAPPPMTSPGSAPGISSKRINYVETRHLHQPRGRPGWPVWLKTSLVVHQN